jgi:hypothetical protein
MSQQGSNGRDGHGPQQPITWVGMQHLMHGYCGRAGEAPGSPQPTAKVAVTESVSESRPVAVVRTKPRQGRVVRIGPPRASESTPAA